MNVNVFAFTFSFNPFKLSSVNNIGNRYHQSLFNAKLEPNTVNSNPVDPTAEDTAFIISLLENAVNMATRLLKKDENNDVNNNIIKDKDKNEFKTLNIGFKAKHKGKIDFPTPRLAREYLSLPAKEYSVLEASFVSRVENNDTKFRINIPLSDFATSIGIDGIPVCLQTDISVIPEPSKGIVSMKSGPISIVPDKTNKNVNNTPLSSISSSSTNEDEEEAKTVEVDVTSSNLSASELPRWLINAAAADESSSSSINADTNTGAIESIPTSVQTGVDIKIEWNPDNSKDKKDEFVVDLKGNTINTSVLPVQAYVRVNVDLSIPLPSHITRVLGFVPLKMILGQAGGLITKQVLMQLVPALSVSLLKDYDNRFKLHPDHDTESGNGAGVGDTTVVLPAAN